MADTGLKTNFSKPPRLPDALDYLLKATEAAFIDVPFAVLKRAAAGGNQRELYAAGWKAYDALIGFANDATNRLYTNDTYGRIMGRTLEFALGVNRFSAAASGALFAALWPALGLPTAAEIEAVREELRALRGEIRDARAAAGDESAEPEAAPLRAADGVLARPVWERWTAGDRAEEKASVGN